MVTLLSSMMSCAKPCEDCTARSNKYDAGNSSLWPGSYLHVQSFRRSQPSGLSVIPFLLGTVGSQANSYLARVSDSNSVYQRPHMAQPPRAELDSRCAMKLRMSRKMRMAHSVILQLRSRQLALEGREQILCRYSMASLVEKNWNKFVRPDITKHEGQMKINLGMTLPT